MVLEARHLAWAFLALALLVMTFAFISGMNTANKNADLDVRRTECMVHFDPLICDEVYGP